MSMLSYVDFYSFFFIPPFSILIVNFTVKTNHQRKQSQSVSQLSETATISSRQDSLTHQEKPLLRSLGADLGGSRVRWDSLRWATAWEPWMGSELSWPRHRSASLPQEPEQLLPRTRVCSSWPQAWDGSPRRWRTLSPNGPLGWRPKTWRHHTRWDECNIVMMCGPGRFWRSWQNLEKEPQTAVGGVIKTGFWGLPEKALDWDPALSVCLPLSPMPLVSLSHYFHSLPSPVRHGRPESFRRKTCALLPTEGCSSLSCEAATGAQEGRTRVCPGCQSKAETRAKVGVWVQGASGSREGAQWSADPGRGHLYILPLIGNSVDNTTCPSPLGEDLPSTATPPSIPFKGLLRWSVHHAPKCHHLCSGANGRGCAVTSSACGSHRLEQLMPWPHFTTERGRQEKMHLAIQSRGQ